MFTETISKDAQKSLALLGQSRLLRGAYLAGGSACALHRGHRISLDFDFFTDHLFDRKSMIHSLKKIGRFEVEQDSKGTVVGKFNGIRFSLFWYKYPVLFPFQSLYGIHVLDLRDLAAMKLDAIGSRGIKRDFVDLYFICKSGFSLSQVFSFYGKKYGDLDPKIIHLQKSIVYFADAELSEMPKMLVDIRWGTIKKFFEHEVKKIAFDKILERQ